MTAVGFEPTPLRTGALSQRLRPLGQTVLPSGNLLPRLFTYCMSVLQALSARTATCEDYGPAAEASSPRESLNTSVPPNQQHRRRPLARHGGCRCDPSRGDVLGMPRPPPSPVPGPLACQH